MNTGKLFKTEVISLFLYVLVCVVGSVTQDSKCKCYICKAITQPDLCGENRASKKDPIKIFGNESSEKKSVLLIRKGATKFSRIPAWITNKIKEVVMVKKASFQKWKSCPEGAQVLAKWNTLFVSVLTVENVGMLPIVERLYYGKVLEKQSNKSGENYGTNRHNQSRIPLGK